MEYLIQWANTYLLHFGAWVSLALVVNLHKNGIPKPEKLPKIILSAVLLAAFAAIFSSHSHAHYLSHFVN
jgi:hypothetical protein